MTRVFNFSAGPATLPQTVLEQAAAEMLDWHGAGMGVMEMSHRGAEFMAIHQQALDDLRELLAVPANYRILFLQGGAIAENALIPMNLIGRSKNLAADYLVTGSWSAKSFKEAQKYGTPRAVTAPAAGGYTTLPAFADWQLSDDAAYLHLCSNETIDGVQFHAFPDWGDHVVVADMSSDILSRPLDVSKFGVIYAGAQKNIGPAGLTIAIVREDLLGSALPATPSAFDWKIVADNNSMYNTPPTYAIYIAGLVFQWLKAQGGVAAIEAENRAKAQALYDCIDASSLYQNHVDPGCRSLMNVPFHLRDETLNDAFLAQAKAAGLVQLKGHKSVGGMRASLYNAMSRAGVDALVAFMREFERQA